MDPRPILRAEGVAIFGVATAAYFWLGGPLWLFLLLALAPDLAMVGYLASPASGSRLYNAAHTYVGPLLLGAAGVWWAAPLAVSVALVWTAHIGVDRAVGYGLKYPSGFGDTHLSRTGVAGSGTAPTVEPEPSD
ncbi:DUF4260 domain-containing protein [Halorientalis regularis]|jgi:hypothetical protein|uniref:DUF4260 domain-containing protein n=1 Tax=Halorientalis regularis TaxID=660518 RepID=A0A1G7F6E8_9EURY|nr:DUF4260 domain-containing protein [Halorientalis regularis]SDE71469.1 protein of unknown function [Halorientalis regularis]